MTKLTELEKQKVIACVGYIKGKFRCDRYELEVKYDKLGHYDEVVDKALEHLKELEEFYSELGRKLEEVFQYV